MSDALRVGVAGHAEQVVAEEDDITKRDSHSTTSQRVSHVPGISDEENTGLAGMAVLLDGREEGVGHSAEAIFLHGSFNGGMERRWELRENILKDMPLTCELVI